MELSDEKIKLFYKITNGLIWNLNEKFHIVEPFKRPVYKSSIDVNIENFIKVRQAMWDNPDMIGAFLSEGGDSTFTDQDHAIIDDWRKYFVKDRFVVMKHLAYYTVVMTSKEDGEEVLYGLHGISDPFEDTFPFPLPCMADLVLLPFDGKIIYDGLAVPYHRLTFGPGIRSRFNDAYKRAKAKYGVVEALNGEAPRLRPPKAAPKKAPKARDDRAVAPPDGVNVPRAMSARYMEVAEIIGDFCDQRLDDEYKTLTLRALEKLCRKRPSPVERGKARTWACGIVYAVGSINFVFDKSQPVHLSRADIADWFGVSASTAASKGNEVRQLLNLHHYSGDFILQGLKENSIFFNLFSYSF